MINLEFATGKRIIIAEIGSVHDGSFGNALKLIEAVAESGADCVKFQTHIAEAESLPDAPNPSYFKDEPRTEYFNRTAFTIDQWQQLKSMADDCRIGFLSSPFSIEAVEILQKLNVFGIKIPSGELTNIPLLEKVAETGKPIFLSSGMSDWEEIKTAAGILGTNDNLTIMQCSSEYPCPPENVGLNVIEELGSRFGCSVGYSDHTMGLAAPVAAVALGATVIEKHFAFSRLMYGSDAAHSLEPGEFKEMVAAIHEVWRMLDHPVNKNDVSKYKNMRNIFQKSIVSNQDLPKGHIIEMEDLAFKKPGSGIPASDYKMLIGRELRVDISNNVMFKWEDLN